MRSFGIALDSVSLVVRPGELVALVGENGAGKTTLVKAISGVLPLAEGWIRCGGEVSSAAFRRGVVAVVPQDLGLCDNLGVAENLFLGREMTVGGTVADRGRMRQRSRDAVARLGLHRIDPRRRVDELSGGERQVVAIARALVTSPRVLILDEPTSSLAPDQAQLVLDAVRGLCDSGCAVLMVSHRVEEAMRVANRIAVMRRGRLVADSSPVELQLGDVLELMSGVPVESVARRNLAQMSSLVDQLEAVDPSDSVPAIVSGFSAASGQRQLAVHLRTEDASDVLRLVASVGLPDEVRAELLVVSPADTDAIAEAARSRAPTMVSDLRGGGDGMRRVEGAPVSMWAVPIEGSTRSYGVLSGFADVPGRLREDQLQLATLYAGLIASAIHRDELLRSNQRRNRVLEALREALELLAGPEELADVRVPVLRAMATGLGADAAGFIADAGGADAGGVGAPLLGTRLWAATPQAHALLAAVTTAMDTSRYGEATAFRHGRNVIGVRFSAMGRDYVLAAAWLQDRGSSTAEERELVEGMGWSLKLALEREVTEASRAESAAIRRSADLQREFVSRLGHELRTPLTTVTGYAESLRATDVEWDRQTRHRFLGAISDEAGRMQRLVGDLLDLSVIEAGAFTLRMDWCDLSTVIEIAVGSPTSGGAEVVIDLADELPAIWADHDRIRQVLANLLDNAAKYGAPPITVSAHADGGSCHVEVADHGPGVPQGIRADVFAPYVRGAATPGAGLGLSICRSIAEAHGGTLLLVPGPGGARFRLTLPEQPLDQEGC